jgi:hypothetical protein
MRRYSQNPIVTPSAAACCTTIKLVDRDDRCAGHQAREAGYAALFRGIRNRRIDEGFA